MERVEEEFQKQKQKKTKVDILKIFFIDLKNRKDKYFHNVCEAYWRLTESTPADIRPLETIPAKLMPSGANTCRIEYLQN